MAMGDRPSRTALVGIKKYVDMWVHLAHHRIVDIESVIECLRRNVCTKTTVLELVAVIVGCQAVGFRHLLHEHHRVQYLTQHSQITSTTPKKNVRPE